MASAATTKPSKHRAATPVAAATVTSSNRSVSTTTTTNAISASVWAASCVTDVQTITILPGTLTIATFNVLAPIWKPMATDWNNESDHPNIWRARIAQVVALIIDMNADIVCLQEYWFDPIFREFFEGKTSAIAAKYAMASFQRTGRKPDGVATLVRRADKGASTRWSYTIMDTVQTPFNDAGQRVALMLRIAATPPAWDVTPAAKDMSPVYQFLISNTHLTFPHHAYDYEMRKRQMISTLNALQSYRLKHKLEGMHAFVVGDFNANGVEAKDNVCHLLGSSGWTSAFTEVHGQSAGVTHLTHRNEQLAVDFICQQHAPLPFRNSAYVHYRATSADVIPSDVCHTTWPKTFTVSDHRPVLVTFSPFIHNSASSLGAATASTSSSVSSMSSGATSTSSASPTTRTAAVAVKRSTTGRSAAVVDDNDDDQK